MMMILWAIIQKQNNELDYPNLGSIFDKHRLLRYKTNQKNNLVNLDHDINWCKQ